MLKNILNIKLTPLVKQLQTSFLDPIRTKLGASFKHAATGSVRKYLKIVLNGNAATLKWIIIGWISYLSNIQETFHLHHEWKGKGWINTVECWECLKKNTFCDIPITEEIPYSKVTTFQDKATVIIDYCAFNLFCLLIGLIFPTLSKWVFLRYSLPEEGSTLEWGGSVRTNISLRILLGTVSTGSNMLSVVKRVQTGIFQTTIWGIHINS